MADSAIVATRSRVLTYDVVTRLVRRHAQLLVLRRPRLLLGVALNVRLSSKRIAVPMGRVYLGGVRHRLDVTLLGDEGGAASGRQAVGLASPCLRPTTYTCDRL